MATKAMIGRGTTLGYGADDTVPPAMPTLVGEIFEIGGPNIESNDVDASNFDSVDDWMEFIGGLRDGGELECTANMTREAVALLMGIFNARRGWLLTFPLREGETSESTWEFLGHVKAVGASIPDGDRITQTFTVKIDGEAVFTAGS